LLTPEGNAAAFAPWIDPLPPGARVLDCACGIGLLAVGLALRGFEVHASDASLEMVGRTRALAERRNARVQARTRAWEDLPQEPEFDAVFCVGNSLAHAPDRAAALAAMAGVMRRRGVLVLTSRNWERERAAGSRLEVDDRLVERDGGRALITRAWTIDEEEIVLDVAVSIIDADGMVQTVTERLKLWPFTADELDDDLRRAGLEPQQSTYTPESDRYVVTASFR
jgi:2-polyprenyl-3-methyl-5-hydroxy-6-metoxy-1,4-benzoquinol methylase